jgi:co-chaperonin GroES (HSP10)
MSSVGHISLESVILVGDRVLIQPEDLGSKTSSGLYLPASVLEKENVHGGRVVRVGPGFVIPNPDFEDEPWSSSGTPVRYLPLQAEEGDYAFFLRKEAIELRLNDEAYLIVPHRAILALIRPEISTDDDDLLDDLLS